MKHARLSASSAHRWLNCAGSIPPPDEKRESSVWAAQGTFAHDIAKTCLDLNRDALLYRDLKRSVDGHEFTCDDEMVETIQVYLDEIRGDLKPGDISKAELDLLAPLAKIDPDLGGTADFARYRPSTKHIRVVDFKFGSGMYVEADSNEQMMVYALGVMLAFDVPVSEVEVVIVQPRFEGAKPVRSWSFKASAILDFIADVKEAADKTRLLSPPLAAGDWCKFCKLARTCPELEKKHHALIAADFGKHTLAQYNPKALAAALASIPLVKERIKAIEEFAYAEATMGKEIPGFKLVDKRANRRWKNEADVIEWAQKNAVECYAPREVLSPAQLEKKIGGKKKDAAKALEPFTEKVSSGTALVPATDDRPPAKLVTAQDFNVVN